VLVGVLAVSTSAGAADTADGGRGQVQIRVYHAGLPSADGLKAALAGATSVLFAAGLDASWVTCGPSSSGVPGCDAPVAHDELAVRLVRLAGQPSARREISLGYSLVDTSTAGGTLATVYIDRVQSLAAQVPCGGSSSRRGAPSTGVGCDAAALLGFAIAHEIGHLLLGTRDHSASGLMRAVWSRAELQRRVAADWRLTADESLAIRLAVHRRHQQTAPRMALDPTPLEMSDLRLSH
jgi:hypothetical protein